MRSTMRYVGLDFPRSDVVHSLGAAKFPAHRRVHSAALTGRFQSTVSVRQCSKESNTHSFVASRSSIVAGMPWLGLPIAVKVANEPIELEKLFNLTAAGGERGREIGRVELAGVTPSTGASGPDQIPRQDLKHRVHVCSNCYVDVLFRAFDETVYFEPPI